MTDLYIIAAGKGSRMGGDVPKALVPITDQPNINNTLEQASGKFGNVFIVVNEDTPTLMKWRAWALNLINTDPELFVNTAIIPIKSGRGDGHAVMAGLAGAFAHTGFDVSNDVVICWGDVFFPHSETFNEILENTDIKNCGFVPVVLEKNPYVNIHSEGTTITGASFAKLGEVFETGLHDQSIFRFDRELLIDALTTLDFAFNRNNKYMTPNEELSLLHTFHYIFNSGIGSLQHYLTQYPTMSFNTREEVAQIQREIHKKWTHRSEAPY